jgi:hypothetical protein
MSQFPNGVENRNRPRILITPIDSKKAFIGLARPWNPKEWKDEGKAHFLDLRTLGWALFNQSFSLRTLCKQLKTEHQKLDHEPTGEITPEEIEYARQDGRCTVDALNGLKREFDKHPISLKPYHAYSPASIAKSYLEAMGIVPPADKFEPSEKNIGIALQSYYGGRSETRVRCAEVPVVTLTPILRNRNASFMGIALRPSDTLSTRNRPGQILGSLIRRRMVLVSCTRQRILRRLGKKKCRNGFTRCGITSCAEL